MKIIFILTIMLFLDQSVKAQDSTTVSVKKEKISAQNENNRDPLIDKKMKDDVFIDKDGDGICDFRTKGMSFEKLKRRNRQGPGDGKGKGKGNH